MMMKLKLKTKPVKKVSFYNINKIKDKQFSIIRATGFIEQILFYFVARKMRKKMII